MAKSWHTYLLLFTYLSGNSPTHTHTETHSNSIKIVLVASVDIKIWARGLLASITQQQQQHKNYCEMQQQQFDWHEKTSGWNWLCHAIYVCPCYMGEYVSREAAAGVFTSLSLQVPASLLRQLQFAWTRAEIKHTPCAPNNNPDLCHWTTTTSHLTPHVASWNRPRLPRAAIRIYRVFVSLVAKLIPCIKLGFVQLCAALA